MNTITNPRRAPVYQQITSALDAMRRCVESGNSEWEIRHAERLDALIGANLPSGSGIDSGTSLETSSTVNRLVFQADYHHMDDNGMYSGWSQHQVIVTPSLLHGFHIRVTGRDRNQVKDYIAETFHHALSHVVEVAA